MATFRNYINQDFVGEETGSHLIEVNYLNEKLYSVTKSSAFDGVKAIQAASHAFDKWSLVYTNHQEELLEGIKTANLTELSENLSKENGYDQESILNFDLSPFQDWCGYLQSFLSRANDESLSLVRPVGRVILLFSQSSTVFDILTNVFSALVNGNSVVVVLPLTKGFLGNFLLEYIVNYKAIGAAFNLIYTEETYEGLEYLIPHPSVSLVVAFAQSSLADVLIKYTSEKRIPLKLYSETINSMVVLAESDWQQASDKAAKANWYFNGLGRESIHHLLVEDSIYNEFKQSYKANWLKESEQSLSLSLISSKILDELKDKSVKERAKVILELDTAKKGLFQPTVVEDLTDCSDIYQTPIGGPFFTLRSFSKAFKGIKLANVNPKFYACSLWVSDDNRAKKFLDKLHSEHIWINSWLNSELSSRFYPVKNELALWQKLKEEQGIYQKKQLFAGL